MAAAQRDRPQDILELRRLLVAHDFGRLDSALSTRRLEASRTPANEIRYMYAYDAFDVDDSALRPHLDAWIKRQPASPRARLARAHHFSAVAGSARGGAWANETKASQFEQMHAWFKLAMADAAAATRLDSTDIAAHAVMLRAMRLAGDEAAERDILREAVARNPATLALRIQHMEALRPRWYGSEEEMEIFALTSQEHAAQNPRLRVLLGFSAFDRGELLNEEDQDKKAIAAYTKALSYGDFWRYRLARGELYMRMDQPEKALIDLNRAVDERPGSEKALVWRAYTCVNLADLWEGRAREKLLRRASEDLRLATALDSTEHMVVWMRKNYPELLSATTGLAPAAR